MKPQRIQLCRRRGFRLQAVSLELNGLPAVNCARPGKWGNPCRVGWCPACGVEHDQAGAVAEFKAELESNPLWLAQVRDELRGKNLACWCKLSESCHCDLLLETANLPAEPEPNPT